jgi:DNA invertase Pin-like site-specific DNA recombinase
MKVKYIRWSTLSQKGDRQKLDKEKYDKIFEEQISGSIAFAKRPKASELLSMIKAGRITDLYVEELSRLGRNAIDILTTLQTCEEHDINVHVINMGQSSKMNEKPNPTFKIISTLFSAIAEQEKELIKERTEMGKIAARQRGVVFGRKKGSEERKSEFILKESSKKILKYLKTGNNTIREISVLTKASTTTILKVKSIASELQQL